MVRPNGRRVMLICGTMFIVGTLGLLIGLALGWTPTEHTGWKLQVLKLSETLFWLCMPIGFFGWLAGYIVNAIFFLPSSDDLGRPGE